MNARDSELYRFGPFQLDVNEGKLRRGDAVVPLTGKAFDLLVTLVRGAGQTITKTELMAALWPDTMVEESNLTQTVFVLRRALGEDPEGSTRKALVENGDASDYILTVPRRGYKFVSNVSLPDAVTNGGAPEEPPTTIRSRVSRLWPVVAGLALLAAGVLAFVHFHEVPPEAGLVRSTILLPEKTSYADGFLALSPDGRRIAFAGLGENGKSRLWIRRLDAVVAQPVDGTEGAGTPFWSPDSRWVAFFANGKLKKIDAQGGLPIELADAGAGFSSWSPKGVILFAAGFTQPLQQISSSGGRAAPAAAAAAVGGEQCCPWFLPDGEHYLFSAQAPASGGSRARVLVGSLNSSESKVVIEANYAVYAKGRLLYLKESTLVAQPFDVKSLRTTGEPEPVAERVEHYRTQFQPAYFTVSSTGMLAYHEPARAPYGRQLMWFSREGKVLGNFGAPRAFFDIELSPDGKRLAATVADAGNLDLWTYDLGRDLPTRFTFDPAMDGRAVWSPDARSIVFGSNRKGHYDLYRKSADGAGAEEPVYTDTQEKFPISWSRDGKFLLVLRGGGDQGQNLWVLMAPGATGAAGKPQPFLTNKVSTFGQFSPDGRWVAYESDDTKPPEIYVVPFSRPIEKHQVSPNGGVRPRWRQDGKEIYYLTPGGRFGTLMAAEVRISGDSVEVGSVRELIGGIELGGTYFYDVSADGQRILAVGTSASSGVIPEPITLVENWPAALKR